MIWSQALEAAPYLFRQEEVDRGWWPRRSVLSKYLCSLIDNLSSCEEYRRLTLQSIPANIELCQSMIQQRRSRESL